MFAFGDVSACVGDTCAGVRFGCGNICLNAREIGVERIMVIVLSMVTEVAVDDVNAIAVLRCTVDVTGINFVVGDTIEVVKIGVGLCGGLRCWTYEVVVAFNVPIVDVDDLVDGV